MPLDGGPLGMAAKIAMSYRGKEEDKTGSKDSQEPMDRKDMQAVAEHNKQVIRAAGGRI